ncbi:hypothetical protein MHW47_02410 [Streptomyces sp. OfavH-34-F]|uniref:hypothetical protein n=1 Tax=Streptomyces sp. OfavH-34-F TaxID=2917760 RepID=UPI001EF3C88B|nr:hypothetical protein [Streptomyces sp. OfavH-34-F]MCG7523303.1 hypothetical protein [Streptomyces sp. OfavH-34-F]
MGGGTAGQSGFSCIELRHWHVAGENGHPEVDQFRASFSRGVLEAVELGRRGIEADLESFDFAEPAVAAGLADAVAVAEVLDDFDESGSLTWVGLEAGAADAGLSEPAQLDAWLVIEVPSQRKVVVKSPDQEAVPGVSRSGTAVQRAYWESA